MTLRKADLERRRDEWRRAMQSLASELGDDHWITKGMGSIAWGRFDGECVPDERVPHVAMGWGFLQGVRYALLQVARTSGKGKALEGEHDLASIHRRMRSESTL
jgi:hypothetical protein